MGIIPVNRSIHDKNALNKAIDVLNKDALIGIFPEGTINKTKDIIMPFKIGAVKMASETNASLVPFTIKNKYKLFRKSVIIEFYKPYKIFYNPTNRGTYAVILNILLTLLVLYLSNLISIGVYSIFHYDNVKEIYDLITSSSLDNTQIINILNKILNMPNYIYYLLVSRLIPFIFLFSRIKDRLMICYFNLMMPLPLILMNNVNKQMVRENKKFINKFCFKGNMIFISMFAIGYLIAGVLACYFGNDLPDVGYIYIIALAGGLLLSSFILPIVLIGYCFAADRLQPLFLNKIQTQILNLSSNIGDDGSEETNLVKKMLDDLSSKIDDKKNDKDK